METTYLLNTFREIFENHRGEYLLPYQIYLILKESYPQEFEILRTQYQCEKCGKGAKKPYSPATYIASSLYNITAKGLINGLQQKALCTKWVCISDIQPSESQINLGIWGIEQ